MVLHMLRGLLGDESFFRGLRAFYKEWRFKKAGTDDLRVALERASGQDLGTFFDEWVYGTAIPRLEVTRTLDDSTATITIQQRGTVMPVPVTISIEYEGGAVDKLVVPVLAQTVTRRVPLTGKVKEVVVLRDQSLAEFDKASRDAPKFR
jgi:aminopeptidase N